MHYTIWLVRLGRRAKMMKRDEWSDLGWSKEIVYNLQEVNRNRLICFHCNKQQFNISITDHYFVCDERFIS